MAATFTARDVLQFLDTCLQQNPTWFFINLEHPYWDTANSRLTLYADQARWALVSEVSAYYSRASAFDLMLTWFGNCLERLKPAGDRNQFTWNGEFIKLIDQDVLNDAVEHFATGTTPVQLPIRGEWVQVPDGARTFVPNNEHRPWPLGAKEKDIGRYVAYQYADLCRATEVEKRMHLPASLPELMTIDEWHHRSWYYSYSSGTPGFSGDAPSSYETYRLIAEVLANRDPARWRPTLKPNNHWTNWPQAGSL
ncbi:MAG TPA: hypothetical protein VJ299_04755 [Steroidobacteraceae bacterium]|jgi:hypothetical protein|nr:hypothetical protein [Steroidobacteraceae bacterium]